MDYAVTDVGTNTIRAVHYDENCNVISERVFESKILDFTIDGVMSCDGIDFLCGVMEQVVVFFTDEGCNKINCFATSAMRDVNNFDEVYRKIKEKTGVEIRLIGEEEEALCDFLSLKLQLGESCTGTGIDLGGGSCQIVSFKNGQMYYHCSEKLGVKRLLSKFGRMNCDNEEEIREYIKDKIAKAQFMKHTNLYIMGGSSKKLNKIVKKLYCMEHIEKEIFSQIIGDYYNNNERFMNIAGGEYHKMAFAAAVIDEICKKTDAAYVFAMNGGVREGYIKYLSEK